MDKYDDLKRQSDGALVKGRRLAVHRGPLFPDLEQLDLLACTYLHVCFTIMLSVLSIMSACMFLYALAVHGT